MIQLDNINKPFKCLVSKAKIIEMFTFIPTSLVGIVLQKYTFYMTYSTINQTFKLNCLHFQILFPFLFMNI